jgi:chromosome segregation ATPase
MTDKLKIVTVPRELYYHEVAYVRGLEAEIERLRRDNEHLTNSMRELAIQVRHLTEQLEALEQKP